MAAWTPIYSTGTIAVANAATTVTGTGTNWLTAGLRAGDQFKAAGLSVTITADPTSNTSLTINPWPGTTLASGSNYEIIRLSDADRLIAANAALAEILVPNLTAFGGLDGLADKMAYFKGAGSMDLTGLTSFGRDLIGKANVAAAVSYLGLREVLAANRTYYVRTDGSDTNDGKTNTAGGAFKTIQKAVNTALSLDMLIYSVTINVGAGTFSEGGGLLVNGNGNARITIVGAGYDQTTISSSGTGIAANYGVVLTIKDLTIIGGTVGLWARYGANVSHTGTVRYSGGTARLMGVDTDGVLTGGNCTILIDADSGYFLYCSSGGHMIFANGVTFKTTAARTFAATALAVQGGIISFTASQVTWNVSDGAVTGRRYQASANGVIDTVTAGGSTYLPGSADGLTTTGGQYV